MARQAGSTHAWASDDAKTAHEVLRRFGLDLSTGHEAREGGGAVALVRGPFEPVPRCPGWLCVEPDDLLSRTREMLTQDERRPISRTTKTSLEELVSHLLKSVPGLACAVAAVVDDDLAVWLSGPLADVLERLIDASGRGLTASECRHLLLQRRGARPNGLSSSERFAVAGSGGSLEKVYELTCWLQSSAGMSSSKPPSTRAQRPGPGATDSGRGPRPGPTTHHLVARRSLEWSFARRARSDV